MQELTQLLVLPSESNAESIRRMLKKVFELIVHGSPMTEKSAYFEEIAGENMSQLDDMIVNALLKRPVEDREIVFSVTAGAPGTGKGTNINAINETFRLLAHTAKENNKPLPRLLANMVESYTGKALSIVTGTGGMTNMPAGEYEELFGEFAKQLKEIVSAGGFVGNRMMSFAVKLMLLLRIAEGARKIQFDLWPRTVEQFDHFSELVQKLRMNGITIITDIVMLRLLTNSEITASLENKSEYVAVAGNVGQTIREKLKGEAYKPKIERVLQEENFSQKVEELLSIVGKIMAEVKQQYVDNPAQLVILELERALERMTYRLKKTLEVGETPRVDELPHTQLNRFTVFFGDTGPAFVQATDKVDITMVSSYQSPSVVVKDILRFGALKIEDGAIMTEEKELWNTIEEIGAEIAEKIVKKQTYSDEEYITKFNEVLS